jgi:Holliday junction resolvase RusA-like endonuclease
MSLSYVIRLEALRTSSQLWSEALLPTITDQLSRQGCTLPGAGRFSVHIEVSEGRSRPAKDVDNYYKPVIDTITYSRLLWVDDCQIDRSSVHREIMPNQTDTTLVVRIERI